MRDRIYDSDLPYDVTAFLVFLAAEIALWATALYQTAGNVAVTVHTTLPSETEPGKYDNFYHTVGLNLMPAILLAIGTFLLFQCFMTGISYRKNLEWNRILIPVYTFINLGFLLQLVTVHSEESAPTGFANTFLAFYLHVVVSLAGMGLFLLLSCLKQSRRGFLILSWGIIGFAAVTFIIAHFFTPASGGSWNNIRILGMNLQPHEFMKAMDIIMVGVGFESLKADRTCRVVFSFSWILQIAALLFMNDAGDAVILAALGIVSLAVFHLVITILLLIFGALGIAGTVWAFLTFHLTIPKWCPVEQDHIIRRFEEVGTILFNTETTFPDLRRMLLSICRSGLFGTGLSGNEYLYQAATHASDSDYAFLTLLATFGIMAGLALLAAILVLIYNTNVRITEAVSMQRYLTGKLCVLVFSLQIFIHIAGGCNLIPLTGIPMPWISSGGSAMLGNGMLIGILLGNYLPEKARNRITSYLDRPCRWILKKLGLTGKKKDKQKSKKSKKKSTLPVFPLPHRMHTDKASYAGTAADTGTVVYGDIIVNNSRQNDDNDSVDDSSIIDDSNAVDDDSNAVDDDSNAVDDGSNAVDDDSNAVDDGSNAVDDGSYIDDSCINDRNHIDDGSPYNKKKLKIVLAALTLILTALLLAETVICFHSAKTGTDDAGQNLTEASEHATEYCTE